MPIQLLADQVNITLIIIKCNYISLSHMFKGVLQKYNDEYLLHSLKRVILNIKYRYPY